MKMMIWMMMGGLRAGLEALESSGCQSEGSEGQQEAYESRPVGSEGQPRI
mgnify:CR=1 FL=1